MNKKKKSLNDPIRLSPSSLNLYSDCPRCFWLSINKRIRPPEKFPPILALGIDLSLKAYYDHWRGKKDFPPLLKGQLKGKILPDQELINRFRSDRFGFEDKKLGVWFGGKLDDALLLPDGSIVPLDNKSHGFPPKEAHKYHINQMSSYTLMLIKNGFKTTNLAYLAHFFFDHKNMDINHPLGLNVAVEEVETYPERIEGFLAEAVEVLKGPLPAPGADCKFCRYQKLDIEKISKEEQLPLL